MTVRTTALTGTSAAHDADVAVGAGDGVDGGPAGHRVAAVRAPAATRDDGVPAPPTLVLDLPGAIGPPRSFDPAWCVAADPRPERERVTEALFTVADGQVGTRGVLEESGDGDDAAVRMAGVYTAADGVGEELLGLPTWTALPLADAVAPGLRVLDLRDGVVHRWVPDGGRGLCTARFACMERPGVGVLVAELNDALVVLAAAGPHVTLPGDPTPRPVVEEALCAGDGVRSFRASCGGGVVRDVATEVDRQPGDGRLAVARLAVHRGSPHRMPPVGAAIRALGAAREVRPDVHVPVALVEHGRVGHAPRVVVEHRPVHEDHPGVRRSKRVLPVGIDPGRNVGHHGGVRPSPPRAVEGARTPEKPNEQRQRHGVRTVDHTTPIVHFCTA